MRHDLAYLLDVQQIARRLAANEIDASTTLSELAEIAEFHERSTDKVAADFKRELGYMRRIYGLPVELDPITLRIALA